MTKYRTNFPHEWKDIPQVNTPIPRARRNSTKEYAVKALTELGRPACKNELYDKMTELGFQHGQKSENGFCMNANSLAPEVISHYHVYCLKSIWEKQPHQWSNMSSYWAYHALKQLGEPSLITPIFDVIKKMVDKPYRKLKTSYTNTLIKHKDLFWHTGAVAHFTYGLQEWKENGLPNKEIEISKQIQNQNDIYEAECEAETLHCELTLAEKVRQCLGNQERNTLTRIIQERDDLLNERDFLREIVRNLTEGK